VDAGTVSRQRCRLALVNNAAMPHHLNLAQWPRRSAFEFFRGFAQPHFSICTRIDVTALKPALAQVKAQTGLGSVTLACHFIALQWANRIEPFRYRLQQGRVQVLDAVHGSTTVLRADDSFGFAYLQHAADFVRFAAQGAPAIAAARQGHDGFAPRVDDNALVHFTTLPWMHFTSFTHARDHGFEDSIPKMAFGRIDADGSGAGARQWMPLSVEVHHALMDGLHAGRFIQGFEAAMREPLVWLQGTPPA
jgi:chloramphenicol O-acetyltransferase type A